MSRSIKPSEYTKHIYGYKWNYISWFKQEPKWWRKLYKHRKRRQAARKASHACMKDFDNGLEVMWHLDKKPWIYYW